MHRSRKSPRTRAISTAWGRSSSVTSGTAATSPREFRLRAQRPRPAPRHGPHRLRGQRRRADPRHRPGGAARRRLPVSGDPLHRRWRTRPHPRCARKAGCGRPPTHRAARSRRRAAGRHGRHGARERSANRPARARGGLPAGGNLEAEAGRASAASTRASGRASWPCVSWSRAAGRWWQPGSIEKGRSELRRLARRPLGGRRLATACPPPA